MMLPQFSIALVCVIVCVSFDASTVQATREIPRPVLRTRRSTLSSSPAIKFAVILDAGSSGSRVHVYRYIQTADQPVSWPDVSDLPVNGKDKVNPGISSYHEKPAEAPESLKPLIQAAKSTIPQEFHSETNIFLFATAGIRSLQLDPKTEEAADQIIREIQIFLADKNNSPFRFQGDYARAITGQEESIFSWITVNWLKGKLNSDKTYGTLDMGGSSVEIGYEHEGDDQNIFKLKMKSSSKLVYAIAHEHFGADQARDLHLIKVVEGIEVGKRKGITPCFNKGYSEEFAYNGKNYEISGSGDDKECVQYGKRLFTENNTCRNEPCNMDTSNQPQIMGPLYLFSAFYYGMRSIGALSTPCPQSLTYEQIQSKLHHFCGLPFEVINRDPYAKHSCHTASYALAVLKYGFKIRPENAELNFVNEMKGFEVGWSLGAMLYNMYLL